MARRKTFRKKGRKQSSRRRRSLKGKGFGLGSMMPSLNNDKDKQYRYDLCCDNNKTLIKQNGKFIQVCSQICNNSDAWYANNNKYGKI